MKLNGTPVEPVEFEAVLGAEPSVTGAVVVSLPMEGRVMPHGCVVSASADQTVLRAALRQRLFAAPPMTLRPARLTVLDRLPTLPNGKTDLVGLSGLVQPKTSQKICSKTTLRSI